MTSDKRGSARKVLFASDRTWFNDRRVKAKPGHLAMCAAYAASKWTLKKAFTPRSLGCVSKLCDVKVKKNVRMYVQSVDEEMNG